MQAAECWGWLKLSLLLWWSYLPHKGLNMFTYLCLFWINTCKLINQSTKTAALKPAGARNKQWNSGLHFIKGLIDLLLYQQFLQPFKKPYWNVFLKIKYSLLHIQGFRTKLRFLLANYSYLFWSGKCEMRNVSSVLGSLWTFDHNSWHTHALCSRLTADFTIWPSKCNEEKWNWPLVTCFFACT